ncbi:MAG TPA: RDD family protein [Rickettsiales bacterium]|nr:RDD family protein [Rickettsiales bacterium]
MQDTIAQSKFDHTDYAGFWVRFLSVCIDLAIFTPIYYGIMMLPGLDYPWVKEAISVVVACAYYAFFFSSRMKATPGMYLLHFHICNADGSKVSVGQAMYWLVTSTIGWMFCFAGIMYIQSKFDLVAVSELRQSCKEQNIGLDDCIAEIETIIHVPFSQFQQLCFAALALAAFMALIWALSIALPKDKTGFHNLLCGTRFVKGRGA